MAGSVLYVSTQREAPTVKVLPICPQERPSQRLSVRVVPNSCKNVRAILWPDNCLVQRISQSSIKKVTARCRRQCHQQSLLLNRVRSIHVQTKRCLIPLSISKRNPGVVNGGKKIIGYGSFSRSVHYFGPKQIRQILRHAFHVVAHCHAHQLRREHSIFMGIEVRPLRAAAIARRESAFVYKRIKGWYNELLHKYLIISITVLISQ
mmetsp:Transcript_11647/g.32733  ORF Transcript_11647/g.32733 Transcript_11647/m.32733 type:complete len:206 (-) Transcript_11647:1994-2611(-)